MPQRAVNPSWRKPAGMFAILALILVWIVVVASFSAEIASLHALPALVS